ncbi:hypothetical protein P43SY_009812 [Pythium insidiosum]|uniref:subtilisin n=1 Tax=Pythium insidiosum TaxID=114742 RepID=A0AAD5M1A5_PYTIN|nr:hypothetical protein P43SY_009812 [Pythium insidiosum]
MTAGTDSVINSHHESASDGEDRGKKITVLVDSLQRHSAESQRELTALLSKESTGATPLYSSYKTFYITNEVVIRDAKIELIEKLVALPGVKEIREEEVFPVPQLLIPKNAKNDTRPQVAWGVQKIGAPTAWSLGYRGQSVVVGLIDTGVRLTHESLKSSFRGEYGWFDPARKSDAPSDEAGHGTAVASVIVGGNGVGVAPRSKWMACKSCASTGCVTEDMLAWGKDTVIEAYRPAIDAWRKAGIIPVFANGNFGPFCETVYYPAGFANVIGVGATNRNDTLELISSKGPAVGGIVKPDFTAPGGDIRCAWSDSDSDYRSFTATSLAAPHVSGAIALLLDRNPKLSFDDVVALLGETTRKQVSLPPDDETCGDPATSMTTFPNNQIGYGRVDASRAMLELVFNRWCDHKKRTPKPTASTPISTSSPPSLTVAPSPTPTRA